MKRYKVTVKDKSSKALLFQGEQLASTAKQVKTVFRIKYPFATIAVVRMAKQPGIQLDLEQAIKEVGNES